jgi:hypothetical protein
LAIKGISQFARPCPQSRVTRLPETHEFRHQISAGRGGETGVIARTIGADPNHGTTCFKPMQKTLAKDAGLLAQQTGLNLQTRLPQTLCTSP